MTNLGRSIPLVLACLALCAAMLSACDSGAGTETAAPTSPKDQALGQAISIGVTNMT